jgi:hypothetical protein
MAHSPNSRRITGQGNSKSYVSGTLTSSEKAFNEFLQHKYERGEIATQYTFATIPGDKFCTPGIIQEFAYFMVYVKKANNTNKNHKAGGVQVYLSGIMNAGQRKWGNDSALQLSSAFWAIQRITGTDSATRGATQRSCA